MHRLTLILALPLALAAPLAAPLIAQGAAHPFVIAESGESFSRLQEAVDAVGDGDGTILIAPGRYRQCAVQEEGRIAFVSQSHGAAIFDGVACEGKAVLVLRGDAARVEGLSFVRVRVPDGNGAGIRIEEGDLEVTHSSFADGECGILSADDPESRILIDRSTFSRLGKHPDGNGAHSVYIGDYGALIVTNSRFERGTGGHYLKSRSARVTIQGNSFDDSRGTNTNYLIDLPNGAVGRIAGNAFVNGTGKDNYGTMITVAPEGAEHDSTGLVIEDNDAGLVPGFAWHTAFVGNWSGQRLVIRNNRIARGIALHETRE